MNTARIALLAVLSFTVLFATSAPAAEPTLEYETYISDFDLSYGLAVTIDSEGNSYVTARYIGNFQQNDILIFKLDPEGDVVWMLPIEGEGHEYATDLALGPDNDLFVTGWTDSEDFPIVNAIDPTLTGFRDAFLMRLSREDGMILTSTFLGGDYVDTGRGIVLNDAGEIYLTGETISLDFPTTDDALQHELNGSSYAFSDAFITKFSADAGTILYSTYLGGEEDDYAVEIALDRNEDILITGYTESEEFPTMNAIEPLYSGAGDIFVSKITADGTAIDYSTYLGGEDWDRIGGLALGPDGSAYVSGSTRSVFYPTTAGAYEEEFVGEILGCEIPFGGSYNCEDFFVTKLAPDGSELSYSSYIGGSTIDECRDITVDRHGRAYLIGYSVSDDFPPDGGIESASIIVSRMSADGSNLDYTFSTHSPSSGGHGIALDNAGDIYITGAKGNPWGVYVAKLDQVSDFFPHFHVPGSLSDGNSTGSSGIPSYTDTGGLKDTDGTTEATTGGETAGFDLNRRR